MVKQTRISDVQSIHIPDFLLCDQESEEGYCEYKWRLVSLSEARLEELVTQMKYRLAEGDGICRYEVGLEDNGLARGLCEEELAESIENVKEMADRLNAVCEVLKYSTGIRGRCASLEVIERLRPEQQPRVPDARIAMVGAGSCGKSTLLAVIASNRLDDAHGTQRSSVVRYPHEVVSGCTSAISRHLVGFDANGLPVSLINRGDVSVPSFTDETDIFSAEKLLQFIDLPGARKYLRTTFRGLLSTRADFLILCVDASSLLQKNNDHETAVVTGGGEVIAEESIGNLNNNNNNSFNSNINNNNSNSEDMWCLKLAAAFNWPAVITLTKTDCLTHDQKNSAVARAKEWQEKLIGPRLPGFQQAPIVCVSCVTGEGLDELRAILGKVEARQEDLDKDLQLQTQQQHPPLLKAGGAIFLVQDIWPRQPEDLPVVGGAILGGSLRVGMKICVGSVNARVTFIFCFSS